MCTLPLLLLCVTRAAGAAAVCITRTQHKRKERVMLLNRKGFVKIAVEQGLDGGIIPVYHLGNTQVRRTHCRRVFGDQGLCLDLNPL